MRKFLVAAAAVTLALSGCARKTAIEGGSAGDSAGAIASAEVTANTDAFSGVVTALTPMTSGGVQVTFLLPDGAYKTAAFDSAEGVSVGDEVDVDGQRITVSAPVPESFDAITMPGLLAAIEQVAPGFSDNHILGNANRAADFVGMDAADITNALAILPNGDDVTALCYIETAKVDEALTGFESCVGAIEATYADDPYAPTACTDACALAESASITSGDDWALLVIAPSEEQTALLEAVSAWRETDNNGANSDSASIPSASAEGTGADSAGGDAQ